MSGEVLLEKKAPKHKDPDILVRILGVWPVLASLSLLAVNAVLVTSFVYSHFQTKTDAEASALVLAQVTAKTDLDTASRLDRMARYNSEQFAAIMSKFDDVNNRFDGLYKILVLQKK